MAGMEDYIMKTDIEIAQEAELYPITEVAKSLGITEDDLELYGKYKAKISDEWPASILIVERLTSAALLPLTKVIGR